MDLAGNSSYCVATLEVQDNGGFCNITSDPNYVTVAGAIKTEANVGLENAVVNLQVQPPNGGASLSFNQTTDGLGQFVFSNAVPIGSDYTLTPLKDDNPLNGVSTYDLVLISKHILGQEPLNTPYKMIAADANKSNSITTFDIVELRKLILGIYDELPNNTSWRFVDSAYVFPVATNPWAAQFPETKSVADALTHQLNDNFIGVKIGDVNNTVIPNAFISPDDRSAGTLLFDLDDRAVKAGEIFSVTFKADQPASGWQFTLHLDGLEVVDIPANDLVNRSNFGVFADALTTSVDVPSALALVPGEFTVQFRASKTGQLSRMLGVSSRMTRAEGYVAGNYSRPSTLDIALRFNTAGASTISGVGFELYQNQPNPFAGKTLIGFHLPEAAEATLSIRDETGRLVFVQEGQFAKGHNAVTIDHTLSGATGLLYYTLETATNSATKKMIRVK